MRRSLESGSNWGLSCTSTKVSQNRCSGPKEGIHDTRWICSENIGAEAVWCSMHGCRVHEQDSFVVSQAMTRWTASEFSTAQQSRLSPLITRSTFLWRGRHNCFELCLCTATDSFFVFTCKLKIFKGQSTCLTDLMLCKTGVETERWSLKIKDSLRTTEQGQITCAQPEACSSRLSPFPRETKWSTPAITLNAGRRKIVMG